MLLSCVIIVTLILESWNVIVGSDWNLQYLILQSHLTILENGRTLEHCSEITVQIVVCGVGIGGC